MRELWKLVFSMAMSAAPLILTSCYNPEYTEEDCDGFLRFIVFLAIHPGPPNATPEEKAALDAEGLQHFLLFISIVELKSLHKILSIGLQG